MVAQLGGILESEITVPIKLQLAFHFCHADDFAAVVLKGEVEGMPATLSRCS